MENILLYEGNVEIYLQGPNAITQYSVKNGTATLVIGTEESNIVVFDSRSVVVEVLIGILNKTVSPNQFIEIFRPSCFASIYTNDEEKMTIYLSEKRTEFGEPSRILYLGVIHDATFPAVITAWEKFSVVTIDDLDAIAFCSLIIKEDSLEIGLTQASNLDEACFFIKTQFP